MIYIYTHKIGHKYFQALMDREKIFVVVIVPVLGFKKFKKNAALIREILTDYYVIKGQKPAGLLSAMMGGRTLLLTLISGH